MTLDHAACSMRRLLKAMNAATIFSCAHAQFLTLSRLDEIEVGRQGAEWALLSIGASGCDAQYERISAASIKMNWMTADLFLLVVSTTKP